MLIFRATVFHNANDAYGEDTLRADIIRTCTVGTALIMQNNTVLTDEHQLQRGKAANSPTVKNTS